MSYTPGLSESDFDTKVGSLIETAPATDTASSGLNGRLQRIAQRLTSLIALVPAALTGSGNFKTAIQEALPAGESHVGEVGGPSDLIDVTLTLDTSAYADGDVMADTQVVTNAVRVNGGRGTLQSITVIDEDAQGQTFDVLLLGANNSLGTENAAPSISDANARDILGRVRVSSADYINLGGSQIATVSGIGIVVEAAGGSRDLYVGTIIRGAATYTASGVRLRLGFLQD